MNTSMRCSRRAQRGVGLMEVLISIVISMLLVLVIYQVYEISEGQKRTITFGSDAQQNASYAMYVLGRELAMAGNGVASAAESLDTCALLRPVPVLIEAGATDDDPDTITVFYGGSSSLSTAVQFRNAPTTGEQYVVAGPVAFSTNDVIAAVKPGVPLPGVCTLSVVNAVGGLPNPNGEATLTQVPLPGSPAASYNTSDVVVNLGPAASMGRVVYTVDTTGHVLRTQNRLPTDGPVSPLINDVVNLKAQYGLDTDNDGIVDTWQEATGAVWSSANLPIQPLATLRQIRAARVAVVTRSAQYEKDAVTTAPLAMFDGAGAVSMAIAGDDQHYRYKVIETIIPLRNALWNSP